MSNHGIPWSTVAVFAISVAAIVVLIVSGHAGVEVVFTLTALLPTLLTTSFWAEKTARQTSNGHVKASVKQAITEMTARAPERKEGDDGQVHG